MAAGEVRRGMLFPMATPIGSSGPGRAGSLLAGLALLVAACGSPGGPPPSGPALPGPVEDPGPPAPTTAAVADPELDMKIEVKPRPGVEALSLDMVSVEVMVTSKDPADLAIPGPPALRLEVRPEAGGDTLEARPHPLRPPAPSPFPVSLEAGERLELGPMDLGTFDLDPLRVVGGKPYSVLARYQPGPEASEREVRQQVVLAPAGVDFPYDNPLDKATPTRAAVPLKIFAADGTLRVEYLWSPDTGLEMAEEPAEP